MLRLKTILVPVDFSMASERALKYAISLASADTTVVVLHVYNVPVYNFPEGAILASPDLATRLSAGAQVQLDNMLDLFAESGAKLQASLREGTARDEILAAAKSVDADLIVLGTHGRSGIRRALLGSVADSVIRMADVPVLSVRGPIGEES
jgi:nucleotide-binding universal stress UspA family protein